jgi:glucose/arabinose dehydrogenase
MPPTLRPISTLSLLAPVLAASLALPLSAGVPDDLEIEVVTVGFDSPVAVRHAGDGSGRLFIVEQRGVIWVFDETTGISTPFLDIESLVDDLGNEQGLLGLAFHPDYATNGFFYVDYTRDPVSGLDRTIVERYTVSADPDVADPDSAFTILEIEQEFSNHNGGDLHFGPGGYLHVGMGDGGGAGDPNNRAQDLGSLLGKMLRIDVDGTTLTGSGELCGLVTNYAVPPDNPFVGSAGDCDEIWAYGLRNPWRFSFDRMTGDLLIGDVGQNTWEEIDFQSAASTGGENYGWDCFEGAHTYPDGSTCPGPVVDPILEYGHVSGNCSVTGGFRYRGSAVAGLAGTYVYGDFCSGRIWFADQDAMGVWSASEWSERIFSLTSFGEDEAGELYAVERGGTIYRFNSPGAIFADGFESGDTSAWSLATPPPPPE